MFKFVKLDYRVDYFKSSYTYCPVCINVGVSANCAHETRVFSLCWLDIILNMYILVFTLHLVSLLMHVRVYE